MKFAINPNPYIRSKRSTLKIMLELLFGLCAVWLCAILYYFIKGNAKEGIFAIINVPIAVLSCSFFEILFFIPSWRKEKNHSFKTLIKKEINSFGYITGIILALLMPVGILWWQLIICSAVSVIVCKMLFGGFGYNIFNPAIVGRLFAGVCFGSSFQYGLNDFSGNISVNAGSTVLTNWAAEGWTLETVKGSKTLLDVFLGNYAGCLGETFTLVILIIGIILIVRKVIDYRICLSYLLMCGLTALIVGLKTSSPIEFMAYQLCTGGIIFGAVFCLTDPVTSPTTPLGKIVFGVIAGFMTMLIRFKGSSAEGVAFSIITVNMLTPLIDNCFKGRTNDNLKLKSLVVTSITLLLLVVSFAYPLGNKSETPNECLTCGETKKVNDVKNTFNEKYILEVSDE